MNEQKLRAIEAQLSHAMGVVNTAKIQLSCFQFNALQDTLAQLGGELGWIHGKANELLKAEAT